MLFKDMTDEQKLSWGINEYKTRVKEAKSARSHNESAVLRFKWEARAKQAGLNKDQHLAIMEKAARHLAEKRG